MTSPWSPKMQRPWHASERAETWNTVGASSPAILYMFGIMRRRPCDAVNDATRADAAAVGIPFPVIDTGNNIAGTVLSCISGECRDALYSADVIIAKGQANVETLLGCGLNIYYAFLVKCSKFITEFGKPKLTPMLHRERN